MNSLKDLYLDQNVLFHEKSILNGDHLADVIRADVGGDLTFQEAFDKTGRILNIPVRAVDTTDRHSSHVTARADSRHGTPCTQGTAAQQPARAATGRARVEHGTRRTRADATSAARRGRRRPVCAAGAAAAARRAGPAGPGEGGDRRGGESKASAVNRRWMRSNCMAALQGEWQRDAEVMAGGGGCGSAWSPASTHGARTARARRGDSDASRDERSTAVRARQVSHKF